jgi:hypothetical protein
MSMTGRDDPAGPGRDRRGEQRPPHRAADGAPDDGLYSEDVLDSDDRQPIDNDAVGQPWEVAERSRPNLSDETADGLSPLEEEMRRVTEDVPVGPVSDKRRGPPPLPGSDDDEALEGLETAENYGDFPGLTDQSEDDTG